MILGSRPLAPLSAQEGLTIAVWFPKGVLTEPTAFERLLSRLGDYLSLWMLLPLGTLLALSHLWRSRGRDPGGRDAVPVSYEPPEGMTPAELGTLVDERVDIEDITSSILDLAVQCQGGAGDRIRTCTPFGNSS